MERTTGLPGKSLFFLSFSFLRLFVLHFSYSIPSLSTHWEGKVERVSRLLTPVTFSRPPSCVLHPVGIMWPPICLHSILQAVLRLQLHWRMVLVCLFTSPNHIFFFFLMIVFIFGCAGSWLLCGLFSRWGERGWLSSRGTWASYCSGFCGWRPPALGHAGFSRCGMWARQLQLPGSRAQAKWLWHISLVVPRHVGLFQIGERTWVSCTGRRILYHWATRGVPRLLEDTKYPSFLFIHGS